MGVIRTTPASVDRAASMFASVTKVTDHGPIADTVRRTVANVSSTGWLPSGDVVVDGVRLRVVDYGRDCTDSTADPNACQAIVLLAGPDTDGSLWTGVTRDLSPAHRVVVPDLVGLGESEAPVDTAPYPLARQAQRLLLLLDLLGIDRFAVTGHGLGAAVGVHLAALAPPRVRALVALSGPLHSDVWAPPKAGSRWRPGGDRQRGKRNFLRAVDMPAVERMVALVRGTPALVLWGENDHSLSTSYGQRVAAALAAEWVPISDAGHRLPVERPERVAEEIHAFVGSVG